MKKVSWLFLLVMVWSRAVSAQMQKTKTEAAKESVAVFVIDNRQYGGYGYGSAYDSNTSGYYSDWQQQLVQNLQVELQAAVENTGKWTVVDWQRLGHVQQLQKTMRSGAFDPETVVRSGKLFGVRWAIYVAIEHFSVTSGFAVNKSASFGQGFEAGVRQVTVSLICSAWMVDAERGIVHNAIRAEKASESTQVGAVQVPIKRNRFFVTSQIGGSWLKAQPGRATRLIAGQLARKLTGFDLKSAEFKKRPMIIAVNKDCTVDLNIGSDDGVKLGELYSQGEQRRDPDTNEVLGYKTDVIMQVTEVQAKMSTAKILKGDVRQAIGKEIVPYSGPVPEPPKPGESVEAMADPKGSQSQPRTITITIRLLTGSTGRGRGVIYEDSNNNGGYDENDKVLSAIKVIEVKGDLITCELLNPDYQSSGGKLVWFFE